MHVKCKNLLEREDGITYCLYYVVTARMRSQTLKINQIKKTGLIKMIKIFET